METRRAQEVWLRLLVPQLRVWMHECGVELPMEVESVPICVTKFPLPAGVASMTVDCEDGEGPMVMVTPGQTREIADAGLAHEMLHLGFGLDHDGEFAEVAKLVGLNGPPWATYAGPEFREWLDQQAAELGPWPGGTQ